MRVKITFLRGLEKIAEVTGPREFSVEEITLADVQRVITTEQLLERLTGLRVHIEQVM
jgi:hypothetical protein